MRDVCTEALVSTEKRLRTASWKGGQSVRREVSGQWGVMSKGSEVTRQSREQNQVSDCSVKQLTLQEFI